MKRTLANEKPRKTGVALDGSSEQNKQNDPPDVKTKTLFIDVLRMRYSELCCEARRRGMTVKQFVVMELMVAGYKSKEIAGKALPGGETLGGAYSTIRGHVVRLKKKLRARSDYALIAAYVGMVLTAMPDAPSRI